MSTKHLVDILPDVFAAINEDFLAKGKPKPVYMPGKYESPIEDRFAWHITKYLNPEVNFYAQYPIKTLCGSFRIDFVVEYGGSRIGFECDGKDFHNPYRDLWRDAMILGTSKVDSIFRLRGRDIYMYPLDLIYTIARWHSSLFSSRGQRNLLELSLESTVKSDIDKIATSHLIEIDDEAESYRTHLKIDRRFRHTFETKRFVWDEYFEYAESIGGGSLDKIIGSYERQLQRNFESRSDLW